METPQKQKISFKTTLAFGILAALLIFPHVHNHKAQGDATTDSLQAQRDQIQQTVNELNDQINSYQGQISTIQGQANTLQNQIKILDLQVTATQAQIEQTQDKIQAANLDIQDVTNQITITQGDIDKEKQILGMLIGEINDLDSRTPLEVALEDNNFTDFLNDLQYATSIQQQSEQALSQIKQLQQDLQARQDELKQQKNQLDELNQSLQAQNEALEQQKGDKQQLLAQTKGKEAAYQKLLASTQADQKALNDEINNLDDQIAAKLGNNKLTPHKGLLAWPMRGTITQGYGNTGFTSLGYSFHNGLDIAAAPGTSIHVPADGTVIATGKATPSGIDGAYGNWVAIKHDTGAFASHPIITLYGHMASYVLKKGQTVKEGDLIGYEGNTGNTTRILYGPERGFHLHFTVFDAQGFTVVPGAYQSKYGAYEVPAGAPYNPLDFLD
ncbi:MAG TPA: peptidoglycan DD-metalloendopeptidase family protein [Patescibacteria group bacterium]|nr:peptidoglycan DD-metalloendopeptidase family protein [Patescibacteria group bacterium]